MASNPQGLLPEQFDEDPKMARENADLLPEKGPVTDYNSTIVRWMRYRGPYGTMSARWEQERPSPSYIVNVCTSAESRHAG